ncbi:MAG TPA: PhzF family phenazine biosynthesis isomerase, partial [Rhizomicrobium sp.]|nr:PhzF family phenazine biosynthesis isomerase [Rhizomicrobium sp.]
ETAFLVKTAAGRYALRWFTPHKEVALCGHATLASAFVIFTTLDASLDVARFDTKSGELTVRKSEERLALALPASGAEPFTAPDGFAAALADAAGGAKPAELYFCAKGGGGAAALMAVWPSPADIAALKPTGALDEVLLRVQTASLQATARGDGKPYDFVSRFFAPYLGVQEDPVTGSAHGVLVPFWARRLEKKKLHARQLSPRGGDLWCTDEGAQVLLEGNCVPYLRGEIEV